MMNMNDFENAVKSLKFEVTDDMSIVFPAFSKNEMQNRISLGIGRDRLMDLYKKHAGNPEAFARSVYLACADIISRSNSDLDVKNLNVLYDIDYIKTHLFFYLTNAALKKSHIQKCPHRMMYDMVLLYRIDTSELTSGMSSCVITERLCDSLGLSEEDLYKMAYENTRRLLGMQIIPISEMVEGLPNNDIEMYAATSNSMMYGASAMLYEDLLQKFYDNHGPFVIIPSSVHELLFSPYDKEEFDIPANIDNLMLMISEVNRTKVVTSEILSGIPYTFIPGKGVLPLRDIAKERMGKL